MASPAAIEKASKLDHLGERLFVGLVHAGGRSHAGGEQAAADLRQAVDWRRVESRGEIWPMRCHVLIFEDAQSEIQFCVVILQQFDE